MYQFLHNFKRYDIQSYKYIFRYNSMYRNNNRTILRFKHMSKKYLSSRSTFLLMQNTNKDDLKLFDQPVINRLMNQPECSFISIVAHLTYNGYCNNIKKIKQLLLYKHSIGLEYRLAKGAIYNRNYCLLKWIFKCGNISGITSLDHSIKWNEIYLIKFYLKYNRSMFFYLHVIEKYNYSLLKTISPRNITNVDTIYANYIRRLEDKIKRNKY